MPLLILLWPALFQMSNQKLKIMKKLALLSILFLFTLSLTAPPLNDRQKDQQLSIVKAELIRIYHEKELTRLIDHLGFKEGSGNWTSINQINCMGKFQFHPETLKTLGYGNIKPDDFKRNPNIFPEELQERVIRELIRSNELVLSRYLDYVGKVMFGVTITKSGLIGAAHLAGAGGVISFLTTGYIAMDANGTTVLDYLREFAGFDI